MAPLTTTQTHSTTDVPDAQSEPPMVKNARLRTPTAHVYLHYSDDPAQNLGKVAINPPKLPEKPEGWTRFVCISDTHSKSFPVPNGDVLLHSGDLTNTGTTVDFEKTMGWLKGLPHKHKIIIAGNHDLTLASDWYDKNWDDWHYMRGKQDVATVRELVAGKDAKAAGIVYLQDEAYEFQAKEGGRSWSVYGSPWSPYFCGWAFNYHREDAEGLVGKFPKVDLLLTHGPPAGIFDRTRSGDSPGCEALRDRLPELRPRLHLAGHIHEARGAHIHDWDPTQNYAAPYVDMVAVLEDYEKCKSGNTEATEKGVEFADDGADIERTVFVNAANSPSGKRVNLNGAHVPIGGYGFQAVVVDMKD